MFNSGNKKRVDMDSSSFWFLLVIPATVALMAYQQYERPVSHPPAPPGSQPIITQLDTMPAVSPAAYGDPLPIRQASASGHAAGNTVTPPARSVPTVITADSAPSPDQGQGSADALQRADAQNTTGQGSSNSIAGDVITGGGNPGDDDPGNGPSPEPSSTQVSGPPVNADLVPILKENPYLPVADVAYEEYAESVMADATAFPPCPKTLFRGGNAYARLRLTLMGCEIPGG